MIAAFTKIAETAIKEVGTEGLKKVSENLPDFAKNYNNNSTNMSDADKPIGKTSFLDQPKIYISDKASSVVYETKGIYNDAVKHQFYSPSGDPIRGLHSVSEMLGKNSIQMPYIGSDKINSNAAGFLRDSKTFWGEYKQKYPESLSKNNMERINQGLSPIVDPKWVKNNPNQSPYIGVKLEHHHRNNTDQTYAVPQTLHRGKFNKEIMHVD